MPQVSQLFVFPVKSLRGIAVESAELTATGLRYDRHWMIVKPNGGFITQRQFPQMVLIHTQLTDESIVLSKTGMEDLVIPFHYEWDTATPFTAKVWRDYCEVVDEGQTASQWLTEAIGTPKPVRLVRMAKDFQRPQNQPDNLGTETHTEFADAAPFLICNKTSLDALNDHLLLNGIDPVTIEHFRPNVVVEGLTAFEEHHIERFAHSNYELQCRYPCQRCSIPTVNVETGQRHPQQQPFSLLAEINPMPDNALAPAFGENVTLSRGQHERITIGDTLQTVATNPNDKPQ